MNFFQEHQQNSRRFPVFPVFPGVVDTLDAMVQEHHTHSVVECMIHKKTKQYPGVGEIKKNIFWYILLVVLKVKQNITAFPSFHSGASEGHKVRYGALHKLTKIVHVSNMMWSCCWMYSSKTYWHLTDSCQSRWLTALNQDDSQVYLYTTQSLMMTDSCDSCQSERDESICTWPGHVVGCTRPRRTDTCLTVVNQHDWQLSISEGWVYMYTTWSRCRLYSSKTYWYLGDVMPSIHASFSPQ